MLWQQAAVVALVTTTLGEVPAVGEVREVAAATVEAVQAMEAVEAVAVQAQVGVGAPAISGNGYQMSRPAPTVAEMYISSTTLSVVRSMSPSTTSPMVVKVAVGVAMGRSPITRVRP